LGGSDVDRSKAIPVYFEELVHAKEGRDEKSNGSWRAPGVFPGGAGLGGRCLRGAGEDRVWVAAGFGGHRDRDLRLPGHPLCPAAGGQAALAGAGGAEAWTGVREAREWGARCLQSGFMEAVNFDPSGKMSEDCLYLNV